MSAFDEQETYLLRFLASNTKPGEWTQIAEFETVIKQREVEGKVRDWTRRYRIKGRKPALQRLMKLGMIHVRTANYSPWGRPNHPDPLERSDPHPKYDLVQWQAMITDQGREVASYL